ncbi:MAG TPA: energy transducer TonB, partial [Longimicrobium sp.]|nr:energy transducer TonB [Longimicrobium sp.]
QPTADTAHAQAAEAYELPEVEERPELLNRADVARSISRNYPREMRRRHLTGTVSIRMLVKRDGTVDPATITAMDSTHPDFAAAAVKIVRAMRFRPARVGGQPVPVWLMFPVSFWTWPHGSPPPYHPPPLVPRP